MSVEASIVSFLRADFGVGNLPSVLTGGIYTYEELGILGVTKDAQPAAYSANGELDGLAIVRERSYVPTYSIVDEESQIVSTRSVIEFHLYVNGNDTSDVLLTAGLRIYSLLQFKYISGLSGQLSWLEQTKDIPRSAQDYDYSRHNRIVYQLNAVLIPA